MLKKLSCVLGCVVFISLSSGTTEATENKNIFLIENDIITSHKTNAATVKEFFREQEINLNPEDKINYNPEANIINGMSIKISRPYVQNFFIDGEEEFYYVKHDEIINNLLEILQEEYQKKFICNQDLNSKLKDCEQINFLSYRKEILNKTEIIPYETKIINCEKIRAGEEKIIQQGVNGERYISQEIIFISEQEDSRKILNEKIIKHPIEKIIMRGVAKNIFIMNASAYTAGYESTGKRPGQRGYGITATGSKASHGTVAVDPKVIPLGTKLFIEGYGYATAADTGGSIKGNKIDLFYENLWEAKKFGRRNLTVYVLS